MRYNLAGNYKLSNNLDFADLNSYASMTVNNTYRPLDNTDPTNGSAVVQDDPANGENPGWEPVEDFDNEFTGTFDGGGFTISNLYVNVSASYVGLFGRIEAGGMVQNIGLVDAYVKGRQADGTQGHVGGLAGMNNGGNIRNCYTTGTAVSTATWFLAGTGGLVGVNLSGTIQNCYATVAVTGERSTGGLVGVNFGNINNCYATGAVTGERSTGGLVGTNFGNINNCFWNTQTSGSTVTLGIGGVGAVQTGVTNKTTAEMHELTATSTTWDTNNWDFGTNSQYPALRTYKENESDVQIQGDLFCGQPQPRTQTGCSPSITLTPTAPAVINSSVYDFGHIGINEIVSFMYTISGAGLDNATPLTLALNNTVGSAFSITPTADVSPVGGSIPDGTTITVTFAPTVIQNYEATITHAGAGLASSVILTLTGEGVAAGKTSTITLKRGTPAEDMTELNFGDLSTDATPVTQEYTITGTNLTSNVTLTLTGEGSTAFIITSPTNTILTPEADKTLSQVIAINFNPTAEKAYKATLSHTGGGSSPVAINLQGTGIAPPTPTLILNPTELAFGDLSTDAAPAKQNYTITGTNLTSNVTLALTGDGSAAFTITSPTNTILTPEADKTLSQVIAINFNPTTEKSYKATLTHTGGGSSPVAINLTGTGTSPTTTPNAGVLGLENTESTSIRLSPNPVTDRLFVQGNGTLQVQVRNILGATILSNEITNTGNINCSALPAGLYLVSVQSITGTETVTQTQRILKR